MIAHTEISNFIKSLSNEERDFVANLDYSQDVEIHREGLDKIIENLGAVDLDTQLWYPYEVIELGKSWLQEGHEREFVACAAIVLKNICEGLDNMNDWEISMSVVREHWDQLLPAHRALLEPMMIAAKGLG